MKKKLIKLLQDSKWFPMIHPTKTEMKTAQLLNSILDVIIEKVKKWK